MPAIRASRLPVIATLKRLGLLPHGRLQLCLECFHDFFVRGIGFGVGQRFVRGAVGERIGHALLPFRHVFAAKHVEQFHRFQFAVLVCFTTCKTALCVVASGTIIATSRRMDGIAAAA